jgi:hypothetical protein
MELVFGAGKLDRRVPEVERLLRDWREKEKDFGQLYLEYEPVTPPVEPVECRRLADGYGGADDDGLSGG